MARRWTVHRSEEILTLEVAWTGGALSRATRADVTALGRSTLVDICREIGSGSGQSTSTEELVSRTLAAIERGQLRVTRRPWSIPQFVHVPEEKEPERPAEKAAPVEEKTWIAIRLVDAADPSKPMPFRRYEIELPDGSTRQGMLDAKGTARIEGIDAGSCRVRFPGVDPKSWARR